MSGKRIKASEIRAEEGLLYTEDTKRGGGKETRAALEKEQQRDKR